LAKQFAEVPSAQDRRFSFQRVLHEFLFKIAIKLTVRKTEIDLTHQFGREKPKIKEPQD
jgi:hypothetical protein